MHISPMSGVSRTYQHPHQFCLYTLRSILVIGAILAALAVVLWLAVGEAQSKAASKAASKAVSEVKQPNIVLMVADDLGWGDVPWHDSLAKAPTLGKLAKSGIILDRHYVQPVCSATRGALLAGKYPARLGLQHAIISAGEPRGLPVEETLLSNHLQDAGYKVHGIGKWHLGFCSWALTPVKRGFDSFFGFYNKAIDYYSKTVQTEVNKDMLDFRYNTLADDGTVNDEIIWNTDTYSAYLYAQQAKKVISAHDQSSPLFLYVPVQNTHNPTTVPPAYEELYEDIVTEKTRRTLLGMVTAMDDVAKAVVASLKKAGMWNNTIFIFFSDNGGQPNDGQINYPLRGRKASYWEGAIRSSSFIYSPMITGGRTNEELIHVTDWLPTLTHLAECGIENADNCNPTADLGDIDGVNQWSAILGESRSRRQEFLVNIDQHKNNSALRMGPWKLLQGNPGVGDWVPPPRVNKELFKQHTRQDGYVYYDSQQTDTNYADKVLAWHGQHHPIQLYNVETDPYERNDVAEEHPDIVGIMLHRLEYYRNKSVPPTNADYDPAANPSQFGGVWTPWMESC